MKTPDWMDDDELREAQRHTWNDLQYKMDHVTLEQRKWAGRGATVVMVAMVIFIICFLLAGAINVLKAVLG